MKRISICYVLESFKSRGRDRRSSAVILGRKGAAYCLVAGPGCLLWLQLLGTPPIFTSAGRGPRHCGRRLHLQGVLDEEITEDFLFSLNLFPPPLLLQDRFSVTTRGVRTRGAGRRENHGVAPRICARGLWAN